jgi:Werner syndrome ATP-dependent helicase
MSIVKTRDAINKTYKSLYPNRDLKPLQLDIISHLLQGRDVVALLATGFGKSVCFQLPLLLTNKNVIVISPLISLMEDQRLLLEKIGIPCFCFNSNITNKDKDIEKMELIDCDVAKILYMTPEYIIKEQTFIIELAALNKIALIAIDEAHCISVWGNDFRTSYKELSFIRQMLPTVPIYACTATATSTVCQDIVRSLGLTAVKLVKSSFDRPNLFIEVKQKLEIESDIAPYLQQYIDKFSIIYVKTREETEKISQVVRNLNIPSEAYHGGMLGKQRKDVHNRFAAGEIKCIVATTSFGMGIDANINLVLHYGLPPDMESYWQEVGRAGRDQSDAKCVLFWSNKDANISKILLKDIADEKYKKHREQQVKLMEKWAMTSECRKKVILAHFDEKIDKCMKCDNCTKANKELEKIDFTPLYYPSYLIIKTLFVSKGSLGINKTVNILKGSKAKDIANQVQCSTYSLGKEYDVNFLKELIKVLIHNEYLGEQTMQNMIGSILTSTTKSLDMWNIIRKKKYDKETVLTLDWSFAALPKNYPIVRNYVLGKEAQFSRMNIADQLDEIFSLYGHIGNPTD